MKKILLITLFIVLPAFGQYNFNFVCVDDTIQSGSDLIQFYFRLENTGTLTDSYAFDCRVIDSIPGWFEIYCVGGQCAEPGVILYDYLGAGEVDTAIDISIYPTPGYAVEVLNLHCQSLGDSTLKDSINVYAVGVSAIEEARGSGAALFNFYPVPFRERLHIRSMDKTQETGTVEIYDVTGQCMRTIWFKREAYWDGTDNKGTSLPAGVYIIRFRSKNRLIQKKVIKLD